MNKRIRVGIIGAAALAMATGAGPFAFAKGGNGPSGNMNLRLNGTESVGGDQVSFLGIGQVISNSGGSFSGSITFTAADATESDTCTGAIAQAAGQISAPKGAFSQTDGLFTISLPLSSVAAVTTADTFCTANNNATMSLSCNRTLAHKNLVNDLDAGQYHCVVTGISGSSTITGESLEGHLDISAGSNSPQG
jgi:hypothetical protein